MRSGLLLWIALAVSPLAWFVSLEANFALAPLACSAQTKWFLYLVSAFTFFVAAAGGLLAWSRWQANDGQAALTPGRRALTFGGVILGAAFAIVILAQTIPNLMMTGCE